MNWEPRDKQELIPLSPGDHVEVQDETMTSPEEAEVVAVYKMDVAIRLPDGKKKVIHRKFILRKIE